ncbi:hypothetical protein [Bradyrhizobium retamae]|uniref:Uncharacterized protein n=1 Tax=Bradyrhizobium retamae TaxID=1300035 RepID=A0A0R3MNW2_9BRAD|nr:hypothetical protein [Bradyrhizobium retamae]KRR21924.1 hypothetical protein CQ13_07765 [Bradyrhizobium retamae]
MKRKQLEIPPAAARQVMECLRAYQADRSELKRDAIAAAARHILLEHMPKGTKLRLSEVRELFERMRKPADRA